MKYRKPDNRELNQTLQMMVSPEAKGEPAAALDSGSRTHQAIYIDADGATVAVCDCDFDAAVGLGCSLSMIPAAGMEAMQEDKALTKNAAANFNEAMNILSSLFMDDNSDHLKLDKVIDCDFQELSADTVKETGYQLNLGRYGKGTVCFRSL